MIEWLILSAIICHAVSGVPGLAMRNKWGGGQNISVALGLIGSAIGILGALGALIVPPETGDLIRIDSLSVIFLLPILLIPALGSIYGLSYWKDSDHPENGRKLRLFYGLVTASLAAVTIAANAIVFLVAWEVMAISAFFLITTEDKVQAVRETGWLYLVATHIATLCLFAMFALFQSTTGSFSLSQLTAGTIPSAMSTTMFILALVSFGLKAGLMPLHMWLPSAHAMAPSHVSALMSGVLIKIGIYGLIRVCSLLTENPPLWWGGLLIATGVVSGVLGVVFALGQHDLKRLLAYHSIENIGIIFIGLGLAMMGRSLHRTDLVVLGLAGALLHVWNHGLFKALLFLSAGAVIHATGTREIDKLGGLAKAMPRTALYFAIGAVAICGLPPLNGFVSELFIYLGLFHSLNSQSGSLWSGAAFAAPALALIGALAVACFVKVFGAVFLGTARADLRHPAHEASSTMTSPMLVLVGCCFLIGLAPIAVTPLLQQGIIDWAPELAAGLPEIGMLAPIGWVSICASSLLVLCILIGFLLASRLRSSGADSAVTWDCGYAAPDRRMQYTASSFAQMLVSLFGWVLRPRSHTPRVQSIMPRSTKFESHVPDIVLDGLLRPTFQFGAKVTASFRVLQAGNVHAYLFYIVLFVIFLLLWW